MSYRERDTRLSETEIEEITATLRDLLTEEIADAETVSVQEATKFITRAVGAINGINPKNPKSATLATAPAEWQLAVEEGAAAFLYLERAAMLAESDPLRSKQYTLFARLHQKEFDQQAAQRMQIRPASAGSRIKRG
ncbi:MAG: hypothetical protein QOE55_3582 [Acidobacteriaceae bacterium]|nr:hypothetical protein [Acidobacteriaceae bacterium]